MDAVAITNSGYFATPGNAGLGSPGTGADGQRCSTCGPGVSLTSQVPRLQKRRYDAVMRDLLGVTSVASAGSEPSSLLPSGFDGAMVEQGWPLDESVGPIAHEAMTGPNQSRFIGRDPAAASSLHQPIVGVGRKAFRRVLNEKLPTSHRALLDLLVDVNAADSPRLRLRAAG